jgi:hypothetical protein
MYVPDVFGKFEDLAKEVYTLLGKANHYWNRSIMTLYEVSLFFNLYPPYQSYFRIRKALFSAF